MASNGILERLAGWIRARIKPEWRWLVGVLIGAIALGLIGPESAINLELAGSADAAKTIIDDWRAAGSTTRMIVQTVADYVFIIVYVIAFFGLLRWAGRQAIERRTQRLADRVAWAVVLAGAFDVLENVGLLLLLGGVVNGLTAVATAAFAWAKWVLLAMALATSLAILGTATLRWANRRNWRALPSPLKKPPEGDFDWKRRNPQPPADDVVGICFSGGGIRSAAYNLGALQVLQEGTNSIYGRAKYLTAVSGGSYIAAASEIVRRNSGASTATTEAFSPGSPEERHLRVNTQYLAPSPAYKLYALATILGGMLVNVLFVGVVLFLIARPIGWLVRSEFLHPVGDASDLPPVSLTAVNWWASATPVAIAVILGFAQRFLRMKDRWRKHIASWQNLLLLSAAALFVLHVAVAGTPSFVEWVRNTIADLFTNDAAGEENLANAFRSGSVWTIVAASGVLATAFAVVRTTAAKNRSIVANAIATVVVPVGLVLASLALAVSAYRHGPFEDMRLIVVDQREWHVYGALLGVLALLMIFGDANRWSLSPWYRRRLATAFAIARDSSSSVRQLDNLAADRRLLKLSNYRAQPGQGHPELIVCGAANVRNGNWAPAGRRAASFTFGASETGVPEIGMAATTAMETAVERAASPRGGTPRGPAGQWVSDDVDLMAAVAISGAAISPAMGKRTRPALRALLALAGVRLGVWLPNPVWVNANTGRWKEKVRLNYLLREMLGTFREEDRYLYVTDGGHWENLGLVELLRRGCTEVYCFDASGDSTSTFNTIGEAAALAQSELGVHIDIRPEPMRPVTRSEAKRAKKEGTDSDGTDVVSFEAGLSQTDHVVGTIRWPDGTRRGHIVLCKTAVIETTPWDVKSYGERHRIFPNHSTLDQLFDGDRFEAYRALGSYTARRGIQALQDAIEEEKRWAIMIEEVNNNIAAPDSISWIELTYGSYHRGELDVDRTRQFRDLFAKLFDARRAEAVRIEACVDGDPRAR